MTWNCCPRVRDSARIRSISRRARWARAASAALALAITAAGCASKPPPSLYKAGVLPGVGLSRVEALLGKPTSTLPFTLPGVAAQVLAYPFGQVVERNGKVIAVTIASDPAYVGPHGVSLGVSEDRLTTALKAAGGHRTGHRDAYDLIVGDAVTRTKDLYDDSDHVMYELAAANANDPEAPYHVISINLADSQGFSFLQAVTNAKVSGLYPGERIDNFTSEPWST